LEKAARAPARSDCVERFLFFLFLFFHFPLSRHLLPPLAISLSLSLSLSLSVSLLMVFLLYESLGVQTNVFLPKFCCCFKWQKDKKEASAEGEEKTLRGDEASLDVKKAKN
jgi:hypothetical protein